MPRREIVELKAAGILKVTHAAVAKILFSAALYVRWTYGSGLRGCVGAATSQAAGDGTPSHPRAPVAQAPLATFESAPRLRRRSTNIANEFKAVVEGHAARRYGSMPRWRHCAETPLPQARPPSIWLGRIGCARRNDHHSLSHHSLSHARSAALLSATRHGAAGGCNIGGCSARVRRDGRCAPHLTRAMAVHLLAVRKSWCGG
jgi:hypothetical protein